MGSYEKVFPKITGRGRDGLHLRGEFDEKPTGICSVPPGEQQVTEEPNGKDIVRKCGKQVARK